MRLAANIREGAAGHHRRWRLELAALQAGEGNASQLTYETTRQTLGCLSKTEQNNRVGQTANEITKKTTRSACDAFYRSSCMANSTMQTANLYYLFSGSGGGKWFAPTSPFLDIASFLLIRGPYAWIGYAWSQCWGWNGHKGEYFLRPDEFDYDVGAPLGLCHETEPGSSVWTRQWSKATATVDCKTMNATIDLLAE